MSSKTSSTDDNTTASGKVLGRLHRRLLPPLFIMVIMCYIDRTNLAFASLSLNRDLNFTPEVYGLGSGLFFLGYSLFMIPSNLILLKVGAPRWLSIIIVAWGLAATCFGFMRTPTQFYVLRFFLGAAEAGAFPGMWYHLTYFYTDEDITLPYTIVEAAMATANVLAAPLAASFLMLHGMWGLHGWQWLFILEGIPSVALGLLMPVLLPSSVAACHFLSGSEKKVLQVRVAACRKHHETEGFASTQLIAMAVRNPRVWYVSVLKMLKNTAGYGILFWAPILINAMLQGSQSITGVTQPVGHQHKHHKATDTGTAAVLLTAVPFGLAAAAGIWNGWHSQSTGERALHVGIPYFAAGALFMVFPYMAEHALGAAFVVLTLVIVGVNCAGGVCTALASSVAAGPSVAVALAVYNAVANIGGVVGPWIMGYVVQRTGSYALAVHILATLLCASGVMACCIRRWADEGKGHAKQEDASSSEEATPLKRVQV